MNANAKPVALVSMPTLSARFPSFQLALLKPTLEAAQIPAQVFSLFMYFGTHVGWKISEAISEVWPCMVGEWIWSKAAFNETRANAKQRDDQYFRFYADDFNAICRRADCSREDLLRIRDEAAPSFIKFCVEEIDWSRFGLVGFTVVFQQLSASLALARALKQRHPNLPIILGGASMEDDIADEVMRGYPQIDFAHCGDGEISFPEFIRRLYREESMAGLRGVMWRNNHGVQYAGRAPNFADMNATPVPDFDEYFYARRESGYEWSEEACEVMLPVEAARGCWWGEKNHCTFCGLNRSGMEFRAKQAEQLIQQLEILSSRYGVFQFNAIDNIMAPEYTENLFGRLAAVNSDIKIHYEIRPNLSRTQLGRMQRGGLHSVQPGVESFSTNVLKTMRKLTTGMRNLELIKWCTYYEINNLYNILVGFPGETSADFTIQSELIAKIPHLQPPYAIAKARADRGSPMYTDPASQGIDKLTPAPCYQFIFPEELFDLSRISYYFEHETEGARHKQEREELFTRVEKWRQRWQQKPRPYLKYRKGLRSISIEDGRRESANIWRYFDEWAALYEFCADARTIVEIRNWATEASWIGQALESFLTRDLMVHLDGRYLSLALPENPHFESAALAVRRVDIQQPSQTIQLVSIS
ncbi:MAG: RiPP maturation radical SAM C-methyltransferase [Acidobacteriaceae bacterium]|nr:RiPP maturation radical SAM C-methyltransferase [Acidobacteriaceae bacterium]